MKILPLAKKTPKAYDRSSVNTIADMKYEQQKNESDYKKVSTRELWDVSRWVFTFVFKQEPFFLTLNIVSWIFVQLGYIVNPYIFAKIVDQLIGFSTKTGAKISDMYPYLAMIVGYNILSQIARLLYNYSDIALRFTLRPKVSQAFYKRLGYLGIQTLEQPKVNDKIYRADEYLGDIYPYVSELTEFIADVVVLLVTLVIFLKFFPFLAPLMVLFAIPYFLNDKKYRALMFKFIFDNTQESRKASYSSADLRAPVKLGEVSVVGGAEFLDNKFFSYASWYEKQRVKIMKKWRSLNSLFSMLTDFVTYGGYIVTFSQVIKGLISVGDVTFRLSILSRFQSTFATVLQIINNITETAVRVREVYYIFTLEPVNADGDIVMPTLLKGPDINVDGISFSYPNSDKAVLKDFSLNVKSGEKIAVVGHNGAGKTTLVKLLCRIYRPTSGVITVDGNNLLDLKISDWYKNMGVLFQDFNQYPQLTVKENIYMGNTSEPLDELAIRLAAQSADALEFIEEFPNKFDQVLSEKFKGGIRPSTGQWQKLAIARFFYRNAPLVIFDEPTASIDAVSEYNIFNKIYNFFKEKTVIIISHRFSTVRNADRIIVLDHGEIVEEGTHDFLIGNNGYYAKAFNLQAKGYTTNELDEDY